MSVTSADAERLERCLAGGGVAVFPTDTVYGIGCAPDRSEAVERLYALKGRPPERAAAVLFFSLAPALAAFADLPGLAAARALLPGPVTLLLEDPQQRYPLASPADPRSLGLRVPALAAGCAALEAVRVPVLQSSANRSGAGEARRLEQVPTEIRAGAELVLDGGELPGLASTVVDLRGRHERAWSIVRAGAMSRDEIARRLA